MIFAVFIINLTDNAHRVDEFCDDMLSVCLLFVMYSDGVRSSAASRARVLHRCYQLLKVSIIMCS